MKKGWKFGITAMQVLAKENKYECFKHLGIEA